MKTLILILLITISSICLSNNIALHNIAINGQNTASDYTMIQFDITWDNSWRTSTYESNWDAAWVFAKWRKQGQTTWNHATLNTSGHTAPSGATIDTPTDDKGVFMYRSANGIGTNTWNNVKLRWNYGVDGVADNDLVEVKLYAIEMVYIPQNAFYVGDGSIGASVLGQFESWNTSVPFQVTSESAPSVLGGGGIGSMGNNNRSGMDISGLDDFNDTTSQTLPAAFPKGYNAFYIMKYETTQEQYVEFLNTLTYIQQARRTQSSPSAVGGTKAFNAGYRNGIAIKISGISTSQSAIYGCDLNANGTFNETDDGQNVACNWMHFADCEAYMDWAGLRPITELEYEKSCRGTVVPVIGEYAWGNTTITSAVATGCTSAGTSLEIPSSGSNCAYAGTYTVGFGPLRVGSFAQSATNRQQSGGSYYGVMDLTGNVREMVITVGNATGRAFTGINGDGAIAANGEANVTNWPSGFIADFSNAVGAGYRGNDWGDPSSTYMTVSGRNGAAYNYKWRDPDYGFRGGRTAQ